MYVVHIVLVPVIYSYRYLFICAPYSLLSFIYFVHCSISHSHCCSISFFFNSFVSLFFVALFKREKFTSDPGLCSGILIPLFQCTTLSIRVNKHHTADFTNFVLVQERRTYYDHRHSGIDETNILQENIAVEGETSRAWYFSHAAEMLCIYPLIISQCCSNILYFSFLYVTEMFCI